MKKITFGIPEKYVPSQFCDKFNYKEKQINFDINAITYTQTSKGVRLELPLGADENVYGFGLQLKGFNHKGKNLQLRVNADPVANTGDSHAPVPFFVTNKGYGMYIDTARYIEASCGYIKKKSRAVTDKSTIATSTDELYTKEDVAEESVMVIDVPGATGVDVYLIEGETITDIVSQYNMLSGGGCNPPEWGLGVIYRCHAQYNSKQVLELANYFKDNEIPCNILGLEPGWQTHSYPCSYVWNKELYPDYREMVKNLKDMGYHINLWEHAFVNPASPVYNDLYDYSGDYEVWKGIVPDFATKEARDIFAKHHKEELVSMGIDGFKLDECDGSDFTGDWTFPKCASFPSGMDGEQYHSMFGTLYMKAILQALGDTKTLSEVRNAGALAASYPFVLYSDLYEHEDFVRGTVNSGFSGLLWTPEVRDAKGKEDFLRRLQSNVFSVQCIINGWYCEKAPWLDFDCEKEVKELLNIRMSLVPVLKDAFDKYEKTGKPPVRALVMDYTDDEQVYEIDDQYMFCEKLMVAPICGTATSRKIYIPKGEWVDYWTKKKVNNGWIEVETENIPVFESV